MPELCSDRHQISPTENNESESPDLLGVSASANLCPDALSRQNASVLHGDVAYFNELDGILWDEGEGERMAAFLSSNRVLMMHNHGVLIAAPDTALPATA